jgi:hypothetical protein
MFPQYSKAQIYVHAKKPLNGEPLFNKQKRGGLVSFLRKTSAELFGQFPSYRKAMGRLLRNVYS